MSDPREGVRLMSVRVELIRGEHHSVSEERVRHYLARDPASWPRVHLVRRRPGYVRVDGMHRLTAARRLGLRRVRASVIGWRTWIDWRRGRRRLSWRRWE
jgi:hypothetical protein